jgi:hypothetical protein
MRYTLSFEQSPDLGIVNLAKTIMDSAYTGYAPMKGPSVCLLTLEIDFEDTVIYVRET